MYFCISIYKCIQHILVPAAHPSHNWADFLKSCKSLISSSTNLLRFSVWRTVMVPVAPVGSTTLPFFGLTAMLCRLQIWSSQHSSFLIQLPSCLVQVPTLAALWVSVIKQTFSWSICSTVTKQKDCQKVYRTTTH